MTKGKLIGLGRIYNKHFLVVINVGNFESTL
jgi:hypothetical protein